MSAASWYSPREGGRGVWRGVWGPPASCPFRRDGVNASSRSKIRTVRSDTLFRNRTYHRFRKTTSASVYAQIRIDVCSHSGDVQGFTAMSMCDANKVSELVQMLSGQCILSASTKASSFLFHGQHKWSWKRSIPKSASHQRRVFGGMWVQVGHLQRVLLLGQKQGYAGEYDTAGDPSGNGHIERSLPAQTQQHIALSNFQHNQKECDPYAWQICTCAVHLQGCKTASTFYSTAKGMQDQSLLLSLP